MQIYLKTEEYYYFLVTIIFLTDLALYSQNLHWSSTDIIQGEQFTRFVKIQFKTKIYCWFQNMYQ